MEFVLGITPQFAWGSKEKIDGLVRWLSDL